MVPVPDRVDCLLCKKMRGGFFKTTNKCKTVKKRELISGCPEITLKSFPLPWQVTVGGDVLNRSTLDQNCAQARLSMQLRIVASHSRWIQTLARTILKTVVSSGSLSVTLTNSHFMMMLSHEYVVYRSDDVCVGGNQASAHLPWGHASAEQWGTAMDASAIGYMAHCSTGVQSR